MKTKMKMAALIASMLALVSFSACAVDMPEDGDASPNTSSQAETTEKPSVSVDESKYQDNLDGLVKYMKAKKYISGDSVKMEAPFIGAEKGAKYTGRFKDSDSIVMELYEYDTANLNDTAKAVIDSVKKDGKFELMGKTVEATLSDSGKYLMIYTDTASEDVHTEHTKQVKKDFAAFKK